MYRSVELKTNLGTLVGPSHPVIRSNEAAHGGHPGERRLRDEPRERPPVRVAFQIVGRKALRNQGTRARASDAHWWLINVTLCSWPPLTRSKSIDLAPAA